MVGLDLNQISYTRKDVEYLKDEDFSENETYCKLVQLFLMQDEPGREPSHQERCSNMSALTKKFQGRIRLG